MIICFDEECQEKANYNFKDLGWSKYCSKHKEEGMIFLRNRCQTLYCPKQGSYNFPDNKKPEYCRPHSKQGMILVRGKQCAEPNCPQTQPNYNYAEEVRGKYCRKHRKDGMINVKAPRCQKDGCNTVPSYGYPNKRAIYCAKHSDTVPGLKNHGRLCQYEDGCDKTAGYGNPNEQPKYCITHKEPHMRNYHKRYCQYDKCPTSATYGHQKGQALRCFKHREVDMKDVMHKTCRSENCGIRPNFNYKDQKPGIYCFKHKLDDMLNVEGGTCQYEGYCDISPSCGYPHTKTRLFCSKHKKDGMVLLESTKCHHYNCDKRAIYGSIGNKVEYCFKHKSDDMIILQRKCKKTKCPLSACYGYEDNKRIYCATHKENDMKNYDAQLCLSDDCNITATFGYEKGKPLYCKKHKELDMGDVKHKTCENCDERAHYGLLFKPAKHCLEHKSPNEYTKRYPVCDYPKCRYRPYYTNDKSNYPKRCEEHKLEDDRNIIEKECDSCGLLYLLNETTGLCNDCNEYYVEKVYKVKEERIKQFLQENEIVYTIHDKQISKDCSDRRPDFVVDYDIFQVIIEVDENQHLGGYDCVCEQTRMAELHQDFGGSPVVLIRFNPDKYTDHLGEKIIGYRGREEKIIGVIEWSQNIQRMGYSLGCISFIL